MGDENTGSQLSLAAKTLMSPPVTLFTHYDRMVIKKLSLNSWGQVPLNLVHPFVLPRLGPEALAQLCCLSNPNLWYGQSQEPHKPPPLISEKGFLSMQNRRTSTHSGQLCYQALNPTTTPEIIVNTKIKSGKNKHT